MLCAALLSLAGCKRPAAEPPFAQPVTQVAATAPAGPWPADRTGLALCYGEDIDNVLAVDADGSLVNLRTVSTGGLLSRGRALLDRNGAMLLVNGSYEARTVTGVAAALSGGGAFTIEAGITPDPAPREGTHTVLSLAPARGGSGAELALVQTGRQLALRLGPAGADVPAEPLCGIEPGTRTHVVVTRRRESLTCYCNGQRVTTRAKVHRAFQAAGPYRLVLGNRYAGGSDWWGGLEGLALYSRELTPAEVLRNYRARLALEAKRPKVARLRIRATLLARSDPPRPGSNPYYRALAIGHFRVDKVIEGAYDRREVLVACWARWRNSLLPFCAAPIGESFELTLESFDDAGTNVTRAPVSVTLDDDILALPWYYDAGLASLKYQGSGSDREDERKTAHPDENAPSAGRLVRGAVLARPCRPGVLVRVGRVAPPG